MAELPSFQDLHRRLEEAQGFLHSFTRGYRGFTREDGTAGIQRLADLCAQMEEHFSVGAQARVAAPLVADARAQIADAVKRLTALKG